MFESYSGATRIIPLLGFPIAQAKSPYGLTKGLATRGADCIVVPLKVPPHAVVDVLKALDAVENLAGILATVPHKFALASHADRTTERAAFYGSANIMRRDKASLWVADMLDGLGFIRAIHAAGGTITGKSVLLCGAGGAGGAIGLELLNAGAGVVTVHDVDFARRDTLVAKLATLFPGKAEAGRNSPQGYDILINATPLGMSPDDPMPVAIDTLEPGLFVGDVVTAKTMTPLLAAASAVGCRTCSGHGMFEATLDLMLDFFLEDPS